VFEPREVGVKRVAGAGGALRASPISANLFISVGFSQTSFSAHYKVCALKVKPVLHLAFPVCGDAGPGISFDLLEEIYSNADSDSIAGRACKFCPVL